MPGKKGSLVIYTGIMFLISAVVLLSFYFEAKEKGSGGFLFKAAVARDIALLMDSLYAVPGDVEIVYPTELSKYGVDIKDNTVNVFDAGLEILESNIESYGFVGNSEDKISEKFESPFKLKFVKKGSKIRIEQYEEPTNAN